MREPAKLTLGELNRATLARQHLLQRTRQPAVDVIGHLLGLQSQAPEPPYTGLWSRIEDFQFNELATLLRERDVARIVVMRGTVHLVTAADAVGLRPLVQPAIDRQVASSPWQLDAGVDRVELIALARELLASGPQTAKQLTTALQEHWPAAEAHALGNAVRCALPLVQLPPRGIWGEGGLARHALADEWLGRPLVAYAAEDVVRRYLGAFGPASVADCQQWSGLTKLRPVFEACDRSC